jgi:hypothetical protein
MNAVNLDRRIVAATARIVNFPGFMFPRQAPWGETYASDVEQAHYWATGPPPNLTGCHISLPSLWFPSGHAR